MPKAKIETIKVTEPPKIPMNFGGKPSMFGGSQASQGAHKGTFAPKMRMTQSKGAGSGK